MFSIMLKYIFKDRLLMTNILPLTTRLEYTDIIFL